MRRIFVNLPVADVAASRAFYGALGFSFDEDFSGEQTAAMVVEENITVMLLERGRFADFCVKPVADTAVSVAHLLAISCDSREAVDALSDTALANGGGEWREPQDHGFMYGRSFADPDGHVWEPMWMDPSAGQDGPAEG